MTVYLLIIILVVTTYAWNVLPLKKYRADPRQRLVKHSLFEDTVGDLVI